MDAKGKKKIIITLVGVFLATTAIGSPDQIDRLLDLLMTGLRR